MRPITPLTPLYLWIIALVGGFSAGLTGRNNLYVMSICLGVMLGFTYIEPVEKGDVSLVAAIFVTISCALVFMLGVTIGSAILSAA